MRFQVLTAAYMKFRLFWDVAPCSLVEVDRCFLALLMDAVRASETSMRFNVTTRRYIPQDSKLKNLLYVAVMAVPVFLYEKLNLE
jgi:hypothetical protein